MSSHMCHWLRETPSDDPHVLFLASVFALWWFLPLLTAGLTTRLKALRRDRWGKGRTGQWNEWYIMENSSWIEWIADWVIWIALASFPDHLLSPLSTLLKPESRAPYSRPEYKSSTLRDRQTRESNIKSSEVSHIEIVC